MRVYICICQYVKVISQQHYLELITLRLIVSHLVKQSLGATCMPRSKEKARQRDSDEDNRQKSLRDGNMHLAWMT